MHPDFSYSNVKKNAHLRIDTILHLEESHFHPVLAKSQRTAPSPLCKSDEASLL